MEVLNRILNIDSNFFSIGLLLVFFTLEQISNGPSFKKKSKHLFQNILFQVLLTILNIFFITLLINCIEWISSNKIGLLYFIELSFWFKLILSVMLLDLTTYWMHRASHKFPLLWRLHRVHHSDSAVDSSTTFRFHPLELILIYQTGNIIAAALFGIDIISLTLYYFIISIFFFFEHSDLKYPKWINNTIGFIFVMPDQHKVHHHQEQHFTDSNFADIFILWDRVFGTFKMLPIEEIKYGLIEFKEEEKQTFLYLMKSPFTNIRKNKTD